MAGKKVITENGGKIVNNSTFVLSAYEVKNNSFLFERLFKVKKNGVFILGASFFFLEIYTFYVMQMRKVMAS